MANFSDSGFRTMGEPDDYEPVQEFNLEANHNPWCASCTDKQAEIERLRAIAENTEVMSVQAARRILGIAKRHKEERDEALALLGEIEWEGQTEGFPLCHFCRGHKRHGHKDGCRLAALLEKHR